MPAYVLALVDVKDPDQYRKYTAVTPGVISQYGGKFVVRGGKHVTMEGPAETRRIVLIEFADFETAQAFYNSPEYQAAKKLREGAALGTFIVVDGVQPTAM